MKEISLHILDIAENSVSAGADRVIIEITEDLKTDRLIVRISDNGKGIEASTLAAISDPFITSRTTRKVGLGIPFFKAAAESCEGCLQIESTIGIGTTVKAEFQHGHIDRMPMGHIETTLENLLIGFPQIDWLFKYEADGKKFSMDSKEIKSILGDVPLSDPSVINYIRQQLIEGIGSIRITD